MDRIDIHMQVPRVEYAKLRDMRQGESSVEVRARVEAAREHQRGRLESIEIASTASMHSAQMQKFCGLDEVCQKILFFDQPYFT